MLSMPMSMARCQLELTVRLDCRKGGTPPHTPQLSRTVSVLRAVMKTHCSGARRYPGKGGGGQVLIGLGSDECVASL